jgi:hypothetical protein
MTIPWWTTGETDTVSVNPTVTAVGTPSGPVTLLLYSGACLGTAGPRTLVLHTDVNLDQYDHASSGPVTQTLAPGTYHWTAMYGGDLSYAPSTSACDDLIVTAPVAGLASTTSSVLSLPLNCPVALCRLHVTVTAPVPQLATDARTPHKRSRLTITLARGTVTIRKHGTQTVALRLTSTGRRFVASHHGRVTATATIATTIGGHTRTVKSRLTLRLATPGNRQQHRRP